DLVQGFAVLDQRQSLLSRLSMFGMFDQDEPSYLGRHLLGLPRLRAYREAALAMHRYFASEARARLVKTPPPPRINDADISLDCFRMNGAGTIPEGITADEWLALCEANFTSSRVPGPRAGQRFTRLEGAMRCLEYRNEGGTGMPKLFRASKA